MNPSNDTKNCKSKLFNAALISIMILIPLIIGITTPAQAGNPLQDNPTETATPTATERPPRSEYERPVVIINFYNTNPSPANVGQDFDLSMQIYNTGQTSARNIVLVFSPGGFLPRNTGGVLAVPNIFPGNRFDINQPMTASWELWGQSVSTLDMTIGYTDELGNAYSEKFTISINLNVPRVAGPTITPTPTPTPTSMSIQRPQIVITNYETDIVPLEPGSAFLLELKINNLGNANAQRVTMIVGGGSTTSFPGTDVPGGVSGASGEFTNFAPLGSSNIQSIGSIPTGMGLSVSQALIVNVTTAPGAYPMKISFSYLTDAGVPLTDEQVITLLVYDLPSVDINFYRDPGPIFAGQPNMLPIQITNLGRKTTILGNMRVSVPSGILENNVILIGPLDAGGYFTLDSIFIPDFSGPTELAFTVDYTDDFNQARQVSKTLMIDVLEFIIPEEPFPNEGDPGFPPVETPETFWQKVWRFLLGLLGLDSGKPQPGQDGEIPPGEFPVDSGEVVPPIKGP
jgi:hypothetical protein